MKLYLDTANLDEIRSARELGLISGVTTNPSLIAKESGQDFHETIAEISRLIPGPISAEVTALNAEGMVEEGRELASINENIVIKVPITPEGLKATSTLAEEDIPVNVTLVFSANQALLAARAGATYISPFVGRLDDIGQDGIALVADIADLFHYHYLESEIIAASIRHPQHVFQAAQAGANIATIPYGVLMKMFSHPLTDLGIEKFLEDWKKTQT